MPGCQSIIMKGAAIVVAVVLVIVTPLAILAWDIGRVIYNPPVVKEIFVDEAINSNLIPVALEWFLERSVKQNSDGYDASNQVNQPDILKMLSLMDRQDWRLLKDEILPPEILKDWVSVTVDGIYEWLDSDQVSPNITWNLQEIKNRLNSEHGVNALMIVYNTLPPCTDQQIAEFAKRLSLEPYGTKLKFELCKFPNVYEGINVGWLDEQIKGFSTSLDPVIQSVPSQLNLADTISNGSTAQNSGQQDGKILLRTVRTWMNWAWLWISLPLLIIMLLAVRSVEDLSRWWGIPLFLSGLATLLPGLIYRQFVIRILAEASLADLQPEIIEVVHRLGVRLTDAAFRPLLLQAAVLLIAAIGLLAFLFIRSRRPNLA